MKEGPDISIVASLIGDPARANMLMALMSGLALTATELAIEAGVTASTASGHLGKLQRAGLVAINRQGRHRYFRLADSDVAIAIEGLVPVAARVGHLRTRPGPRNEALRHARSCYDHLAGHLAVGLCERWFARKLVVPRGEATQLTPKGRRFMRRLGIDVVALEKGRRPLCRTCIDWSERRTHLAGILGAEVLEQALRRGWAVREGRTRILNFTWKGEQRFIEWYSAGG